MRFGIRTGARIPDAAAASRVSISAPARPNARTAVSTVRAAALPAAALCG